jgi:hypothetical protein
LEAAIGFAVTIDNSRKQMIFMLNVAFSLLLRTIGLIFAGFVTTKLWAWFIIERFHQDSLNIVQATGLMMFVYFVTSGLEESTRILQTIRESEKNKNPLDPSGKMGFWAMSHTAQFFTVAISYPISLFVAWLLHVISTH